MICDDLIANYLSGLKDKFSCSVLPNGRICLVTPYVYPDHDNVEVFVRPKLDRVIVSDLGETLRRLDTIGMDVLDTPNLSYTAHRIADGFGVKINEGVILKEGRPEAVGRLVFEVLSVCKAIGDLVYGSKAFRPVKFTEEVAGFLRNHDLRFDRKVPARGQSGSTYKVAFGVYPGGTTRILVEPLSPPRNSGVRRKVNATFRMWADINGDPKNQVSLINDDMVQFGEEDVALLRRFSTVHRWTRRDNLLADIRQDGSLTAP